MNVVINTALSAARWSRDRQFLYILLMSFSGKLFPLIFRPLILEVEGSVDSSTLHCKQSPRGRTWLESLMWEGVCMGVN